MARKLFGLGARGDIVGQIQRALEAAGHSPKEIDEVYGEDTLDAVVAFQGEKRLDCTGVINETTWSALMHAPLPALHERSLGVTAAFEGHSYTRTRGNIDGAWLSWGIVGFTMKYNQLQPLLLQVHAKHPEALKAAFGQHAAQLLEILNQPAPQQKAWATSITMANGGITEPWRSGFARLGAMPIVQAEQRRAAYERFYRPALETAGRFGIGTELGLTLLFDIHVQNGGISAAAGERIREDMAGSHDSSESNLREIIAEAVADDAIPKFRDDVRARKLAIARGRGTVHAREYDFSNWGLADLAANAVVA